MQGCDIKGCVRAMKGRMSEAMAEGMTQGGDTRGGL